ncbi:hypothetical protein Q7P37_002227 [Cladosporium fusiforme]
MPQISSGDLQPPGAVEPKHADEVQAVAAGAAIAVSQPAGEEGGVHALHGTSIAFAGHASSFDLSFEIGPMLSGSACAGSWHALQAALSAQDQRMYGMYLLSRAVTEEAAGRRAELRRAIDRVAHAPRPLQPSSSPQTAAGWFCDAAHVVVRRPPARLLAPAPPRLPGYVLVPIRLPPNRQQTHQCGAGTLLPLTVCEGQQMTAASSSLRGAAQLLGVVEFDWVRGLGAQGELVQARDRQRAAPWTSTDREAAELRVPIEQKQLPVCLSRRVCVWMARQAANGLFALLLCCARPQTRGRETKTLAVATKHSGLWPIVGGGRGKGSEGMNGWAEAILEAAFFFLPLRHYSTKRNSSVIGRSAREEADRLETWAATSSAVA